MQIEFEGKQYEFPDDATDDEIAAALETAAPASPAAPPSVGYDMAASAAAGIPRGIIETAMSPVSIGRMAEQGAGWLFDKGEAGVRALVGAEPVDQAAREELDQQRWSTQIGDLIFGAQDAVRGVMDENLYEPQTSPGKFAGAVAEFAAPGAWPSKAARQAPDIATKIGKYAEDFVGNVVAPAVLSEGAGQLTEGTALEGPARIAGAITGNVGTAAARAYSAPESIVRRATGEMSDADWQKAVALQNNPTGVKLTGPEAIAQAKDGATALPSVQRYVEGSVDGRARMAPFIAARPGQVDTAVGGVLDAVGPQAADPFTLGPKAAAAGENVVKGVRQDINAQTRPLYQAAEPQIIPDAEFAPIAADPRFQAGLARLRADPELAEFANMPDNSIGVVDAVTKDMFARGEAMAERANPLYGPYKGALNTSGAVTARDTASRTSPEYAQALGEQEMLRETILGPVEQGPVGKVAAAKDTAGAGNALLPQNPMTGAGSATADAARRLVAEDPDTIQGLVRQNLGDRYQKAATETQNIGTDFAGAKFHKDVAGNAARQETLDAVLGALPNAPTALADQVLEILQATGRRMPQNSATSFNDSIAGDISAMNGRGQVGAAVASGGLSIPVRVADWARRTGHRNSVSALADMFIDPNSVEQIRNAANRAPRVNAGEALIRTMLQSGVIQDER
jgi:hypothetical protein